MVTGELYESHRALLSRLEAHRCAGCDVQTIAARLLTVEHKRGVGLVEVIVRADLNGTITGVGNLDCERLTPGVELDVAGLCLNLTWDHCWLRLPLLQKSNAETQRKTRENAEKTRTELQVHRVPEI